MSVLVGKPAPDFTAPAVLGSGEIVDNFNLAETIKSKKAVVFFYPLDFTFVCPSELIAFDNRIEAFQRSNVEVIGISIDSHWAHNAWRNKSVDEGGIGPVKYTLVADMKHTICQDYGVQSAGGVAYRGSFLIDEEGVVRHQVVNDLPLGRNVDEMLRMVDALKFHQQHGEVCPAGWEEGKSGMKPSPKGVSDYLKDNSSKL